MPSRTKIFAAAYTLLVIGLFAGALAMVAFYTPTETTMGPIQKIFYLHLPVAINTFLACLIVFVGSVGYLWQRRTLWDDLAVAGAKIAVLYCSIVLLTGMIWARGAWGQWWTWSPRLTFSLMLWLLYIVYLVVRASVESSHRRAVISAVYGIVAFLDVPLVYLSARLMPDIHPASIELAPAMKLTLAVWFVPVTLMGGGLVYLRFKLARAQTIRREQLQQENAFSALNTDRIPSRSLDGGRVWSAYPLPASAEMKMEVSHD